MSQLRYSIIITKVLNKLVTFNWGITLLSFITAIILYPQLPGQVPDHINVVGAADGYGNKLTIFIMPIGLLVIGFLSSSKLIDSRYADLTIQNTFLKTLMLAILILLWYGTGLFFFTYAQLLR
ncbi:MAG: DUF1648 domain-containing protein [Lentilactobacillus hilgardii]|jgi:uncharacterized membrane protein|uniref:DUF1648 domain-containing protein n=1 Tax=Lentilactobacillus hilgardii TaxID=1588 RepID=A0A6P1EB08_LENHI|nr:DUF1648 domain-containing protein [Lentilactobacillus hilgardii]RRG12475.1 MAG: DUF1648 domain-containing protein [Lactobacillus sp.]EEI70993.1 hypothetical protein HMPREF0496_1727 [Lentilactobacillus hilgardii ATCC 27305]MBZ2201614.1 DUF1648 domain-containing protein [Lentilactobacillus hilgardii]MBZ2202900.1 DUF1648 domain-containing protein [Lentilactobacillus hilgardii]MCT3391336.1 DUF1648 domain-containing protein [Lentilactobacillus hilgardii]